MKAMRKGKELQLVKRGRFIVAVEVDVVYAEDDPTDSCVTPKTMEFLEEVARRAEAGDVTYLRSVGQVYRALPPHAGKRAKPKRDMSTRHASKVGSSRSA